MWGASFGIVFYSIITALFMDYHPLPRRAAAPRTRKCPGQKAEAQGKTWRNRQEASARNGRAKKREVLLHRTWNYPGIFEDENKNIDIANHNEYIHLQ
jgi:hypothetical protein